MKHLRLHVRKTARWIHLWLGLVVGLAFCVMCLTGGILVFRPQIAALFSPGAIRHGPCTQSVDWDRAARDVTAFAGSEIDQIDLPAGSDPRCQFHMIVAGDEDHKYVIYDACRKRCSASPT